MSVSSATVNLNEEHDTLPLPRSGFALICHGCGLATGKYARGPIKSASYRVMRVVRSEG